MEPTDRIDHQSWMTAPETRAVFAALTADGAMVRFVGGCVRDSVLGRPIKDIDVATEDRPEKVVQLLDRAGLKSIPTGIQHGTVTALSGHRPYEVTTLRKDVETFGRHARVAFTDDWAEDAARRDFTLNALYCDPDGTLYDPVNGLVDARAGRVRFVGDPARRIKEDRLRILRFFRFHAWFGKGELDPNGLAACRAGADGIKELSAERVRAEFLRLLEAPDPAPIVEIMSGQGIFANVLPEAARFARLDRMVKIECCLGRNDPVRRLGAVLDAKGEDIPAISDRLRLSNAERDRLINLFDCVTVLNPSMSEVEARAAHYRLGDALFMDAALQCWADGGADPDASVWRTFIDAAERRERPNFPLRGADALALGVPAGPQVGALLGRVEDWWIEGDFRVGRDACLRELERTVA